MLLRKRQVTMPSGMINPPCNKNINCQLCRPRMPSIRLMLCGYKWLKFLKLDHLFVAFIKRTKCVKTICLKLKAFGCSNLRQWCEKTNQNCVESTRSASSSEKDGNPHYLLLSWVPEREINDDARKETCLSYTLKRAFFHELSLFWL